jgi:CRP/FNR family cyclic AMP-dependent transcriptional regulator
MDRPMVHIFRDFFTWAAISTELHDIWRRLSNNSLLIVVSFAWAEALTSIGATFTKRMIPLRKIAMLNNLLGVLVGTVAGSAPTAIKHIIGLPLNAARMREMNRLIANVRHAHETDLNVEWLKPFMHPRRIKAGHILFRKGDDADEAFLLTEGKIELPEVSVVLTPGKLFGEMALFTGEGKRTASAICLSDVRLLTITYEQFEQLYFQNPEFGLYLVRLIVRRFMTNQSRATHPHERRPPRRTARNWDESRSSPITRGKRRSVAVRLVPKRLRRLVAPTMSAVGRFRGFHRNPAITRP